MKVIISIPEKTFNEADEMARILKLSRSRFYEKALRYYLKNGADEEINKRINKVCAEVDTSLDPQLRAYVIKCLSENEWDEL
jgi:metal-responsive CopG/Arc/MetJ family transcriptional regulator